MYVPTFFTTPLAFESNSLVIVKCSPPNNLYSIPQGASHARAHQALSSLAQDGLISLHNGTSVAARQAPQRLVMDLTLVALPFPPHELKEAFSLAPVSSSSSSSAGGRHLPLVVRHRVALVISERVRKSVLEPLAPLHMALHKGSRGSSSSHALSLH